MADPTNDILNAIVERQFTPEAPVAPVESPTPPEEPKAQAPVVPEAPPAGEPAKAREEFDTKAYLRSIAQKAELGVEPEDDETFVRTLSELREKARKADVDPFANDLMRRANEYVAGEGDINFFLQSQALDVDKLKADNPEELLFLHKKLTDGAETGIDDETLRTVVENKYTIDTDRFDIDPTDLATRKYERAKALSEAERFLKEWQVKNAVPPQEVERRKQEQAVEAQNRLYMERLEKSKGTGEITVAGEKISIPWKDDKGKAHPVAQKVLQAMEDPHGFIMSTFATDGVLDPAKIRDAAYLLMEKDNIAGIFTRNGESRGIAEVVDRVENPSVPGGDGRPAAKSREQRTREDIAKHFFGT
jgi:hypothetical protein